MTADLTALTSADLPSADLPAADALRQIWSLRREAVSNPDASRLDALHADGFVLCSPSGNVWTKTAYIDALLEGSFSYTRFEPMSEPEIIADATIGAVRYRSQVEVAVYGRHVGQVNCWHLDVYEREADGRWRCRFAHVNDTPD